MAGQEVGRQTHELRNIRIAIRKRGRLRTSDNMKTNPAVPWRKMTLGAGMVLGGAVLFESGPDIGTWLVSVHVPSTQTDNPVIALPLYLIGLLLQLGAVLIIELAGAILGITGAILLIVGLVRRLRSRGKVSPPPTI